MSSRRLRTVDTLLHYGTFPSPRAGVAQLARARACQARGRRFDPGHPLSQGP